MNGKARIAAAMAHRLPDRVPVMCQLSLGHYFLNAGLPPHRIWFTSEGFAEALVKMQQRYRFDGILIILSTACSVAPRVEPWKLELFTPLAEEIGRYD